MYKHVHTRLNDIRKRLYHCLYIPCTYHVHTCIYICSNVHTCMSRYTAACLCFSIMIVLSAAVTVLQHCTYTVHTWFRHVCTRLYQDSRCTEYYRDMTTTCWATWTWDANGPGVPSQLESFFDIQVVPPESAIIVNHKIHSLVIMPASDSRVFKALAYLARFANLNLK